MPRRAGYRNWDDYALKVAGLRMDESVVFPDLENDKAGLAQLRSALYGNPHSKAVRMQVVAVPQGVKVVRFAGKHKQEQERVALEKKPEVPVAVVATDGKCMERACPFPAGSNGLCRQHTRWAQEMVSHYGSSLDEKSLSGA